MFQSAYFVLCGARELSSVAAQSLRMNPNRPSSTCGIAASACFETFIFLLKYHNHKLVRNEVKSFKNAQFLIPSVDLDIFD